MRTFVLFAAVALTACPKVGSPGTDAGRSLECETRDECPAGKVCTTERFCDDCSSSGQCRLKEQCNPTTLTCELRAGWGQECATNEQCQAGAWCMQGLCRDRSAVSLCPGGNDVECPSGFRCNTLNAVCEENLGCSESADCGATEVCNLGSHACVPRCTPETQDQVCAGGEKCSADHCVRCDAASDCEAGLSCDAAGNCVQGQRCYQDRDCKVPRVCHLQTGSCVDKLPPCTSDENCATGKRCSLSTGKCVFSTCQADPYEPNNDAAHARGVAPGNYPDLTLCQGDVDFFSFPLSRGDRLGVNVDADPFSEYGFSTVVRDWSGRTLAAGKLLTSYVAPGGTQDGGPTTYYVAISSVDPYQPYGVTFLLSRGVPCDDDGLEPNDTPAQAQPLNAASAIDAAICPQNPDYFEVRVPVERGVKASLRNYNSGNGLLRLCLLDAAGTAERACSEDPVAPVAELSSRTAAGQNLLVKVAGSTDRLANTYTLTLEFP